MPNLHQFPFATFLHSIALVYYLMQLKFVVQSPFGVRVNQFYFFVHYTIVISASHEKLCIGRCSYIAALFLRTRYLNYIILHITNLLNCLVTYSKLQKL
jgi:hypothetical protein